MEIIQWTCTTINIRNRWKTRRAKCLKYLNQTNNSQQTRAMAVSLIKSSLHRRIALSEDSHKGTLFQEIYQTISAIWVKSQVLWETMEALTQIWILRTQTKSHDSNKIIKKCTTRVIAVQDMQISQVQTKMRFKAILILEINNREFSLENKFKPLLVKVSRKRDNWAITMQCTQTRCRVLECQICRVSNKQTISENNHSKTWTQWV